MARFSLLSSPRFSLPGALELEDDDDDLASTWASRVPRSFGSSSTAESSSSPKARKQKLAVWISDDVSESDDAASPAAPPLSPSAPCETTPRRNAITERRSASGLSAHQCIQRSAFFGGRDKAFLWQLAITVELEHFAAGDEILVEGDVGYKMYMLTAGVVEVLVGKSKAQVSILEPGCVFGESALFGETHRQSTVRAVEGGDAFVVHQRHFSALLRKFPEERKHFAALALADHRKRVHEEVDKLASGRRISAEPCRVSIAMTLPDPVSGRRRSSASPSGFHNMPVLLSARRTSCCTDVDPPSLHLSSMGQRIVSKIQEREWHALRKGSSQQPQTRPRCRPSTAK